MTKKSERRRVKTMKKETHLFVVTAIGTLRVKNGKVQKSKVNKLMVQKRNRPFNPYSTE